MELIKIETNEKLEAVISGRELHEKLNIKTPYTQWFERMCEYGFVENTDYVSLSQKCEKPNGGRPEQNHILKIDMAKEIAMLQRSEEGKAIRKYFIEVEKEFNSPERIMARALKVADETINNLKLENKQQKETIKLQEPKALFADSVATSNTCILVGELAKLLKQNGIDMGQNRLFEWLRNKNYLISRKGSDFNMPTQKSMDMGLLEIKETSITDANGSVKVCKTTKVTGKGQIYFINKHLKV